MAGHPVVEVEEAAAVGAEWEGGDVDVREKCFADGTAEEVAVVADGLGRRRIWRSRHRRMLNDKC